MTPDVARPVRWHTLQAVRWLDRARAWKARGFDDAAAHCSDKVVSICDDVAQRPPADYPRAQRERMAELRNSAERIKALPRNVDALEASVLAVWNGHEMHRKEHQQEKTAEPLIHGQPNIKREALFGAENRAETAERKYTVQEGERRPVVGSEVSSAQGVDA